MLRTLWLLVILVPLMAQAQTTQRYFRQASRDPRLRYHFTYEIFGADTVRTKCYRCSYDAQGRLVGCESISAGERYYSEELSHSAVPFSHVRIDYDPETYCYSDKPYFAEVIVLDSDGRGAVLSRHDSHGRTYPMECWVLDTLGRVVSKHALQSELSNATTDYSTYWYRYDSNGRVVRFYTGTPDSFKLKNWQQLEYADSMVYDRNSNRVLDFYTNTVEHYAYDSLGYRIRAWNPEEDSGRFAIFDRYGNRIFDSCDRLSDYDQYDSLNHGTRSDSYLNGKRTRSLTFSDRVVPGLHIRTVRTYKYHDGGADSSAERSIRTDAGDWIETERDFDPSKPEPELPPFVLPTADDRKKR